MCSAQKKKSRSIGTLVEILGRIHIGLKNQVREMAKNFLIDILVQFWYPFFFFFFLQESFMQCEDHELRTNSKKSLQIVRNRFYLMKLFYYVQRSVSAISCKKVPKCRAKKLIIKSLAKSQLSMGSLQLYNSIAPMAK